MVGSIDPRCETARGTHWPKKVAWLFGARVAETILASGPKSPHQQAGHMDASDPIKPSKKLLWHGGRPHMGPGSRGACHRAGRRPDPLAWPGRRGFCTRALTQFSNSRFQIWPRIPAARCARGFARTVRPGKQRAWGMPGAQCTRSLACEMEVSTRASSPQVQPDSPGIPARNGFNGLFRALPGDEFVLSPSSAD